MAIYIEESYVCRRKYFTCIEEDETGNEISRRSLKLPIYSIKRNGFLYIMLYDDQMNLNEDVCRYLNSEIRYYSENTRMAHAMVLRLFYVFLIFFGYEIDSLNKYAVERLISFFSGDDFRQNSSMKIRSRKTVNNYLSVIRSYINYKGILCHALEDKCQNSAKQPLNISLKRNASSLTTNPHANDYVRPYVSPKEYIRLCQVAVRHNDTQAVILMCLMFLFGLRIGECLGITEEDIIIIEGHDRQIPTLMLRNRLSDKPFQFAKGLGHVTNKEQYKSKNYSQSRITLTRNFYMTLIEYADNVRLSEMKHGTYDLSCADSVSSEFVYEKNHYVFRNVHGRPLSQQAWNYRLKQYFQEAAIPIDVGKRRNNLSHRFRHGCAMYYLRFAEQKMSLEEVSALLRHNNTLTTEIYEKMTYEDELLEKEMYQKNLFLKMPEINILHNYA